MICTVISNPLFFIQELEEFCLRFALNHMTAVVQSDTFMKLDPLIMKDFIAEAAKNGAFKT